jgi:hypothetical protein
MVVNHGSRCDIIISSSHSLGMARSDGAATRIVVIGTDGATCRDVLGVACEEQSSLDRGSNYIESMSEGNPTGGVQSQMQPDMEQRNPGHDLVRSSDFIVYIRTVRLGFAISLRPRAARRGRVTPGHESIHSTHRQKAAMNPVLASRAGPASTPWRPRMRRNRGLTASQSPMIAWWLFRLNLSLQSA